ncbi:MAG: hypothetical protein NTZ05_22765 [Chloroflexi bacterium]|nr:hypothetical protein [Chloroflexota bacterium]
MERMVLTAPNISSEHGIHAIDHAVGALNGARVVESSIAAKQVIVQFDAATTSLDQIKAALAESGYAVATAWEAPHQHGEGHGAEAGHGQDGVPSRPEDLVFAVRLLRDGVTAVVGYNCACGCKPQARYQKDAAESGHEHCCCGLAHFAGSDASRQLQDYLAQRRADGLDGDRVYELGERQVEAPWGGPLAVAFAIPK